MLGETKRNVEIRWTEHENPSHKSEPSDHLTKNSSHSFTWSILSHAPTNQRTRKNLEAYFIAIMKPSINDQNDSKKLHLFRNGIT